jgi:DNA helicase-2/ATP-dependent DNA helicase PcrA
MHGTEYYPQPSRFLGELPKEVLNEVRLGSNISNHSALEALENATNNDGGFNLGQRVIHSKFGEGVILNLEGKGSNARVQVNFEETGNKWLVLAYANLQIQA